MILCTKAQGIRDSLRKGWEVDQERYDRTGDPKYKAALAIDKRWVARKIHNHMNGCIECGR
ncbi:hypothetical protein [Streptomyces xanthochromogenes]